METALQHLQKAKSDLLEGRNSTWYIDQGKILIDKITNLSDAVDRCLENLYAKRTRVKHFDLNLSHSAKYQSNKNIALKDAINKILSSKSEIEIDSSYSQEKGGNQISKERFSSARRPKTSGKTRKSNL